MKASPPPRSVVVDTGALLALASSRDQFHARARRTLAQLQSAATRLVSHTLVLGELHGHLIRRIEPREAQRIVVGLLSDPAFRWLEVSPDLLGRAFSGWIDRFDDQRFSLTDAVTFEIMREERIGTAFAYDSDFVTAGFSLLP
jgi:predicted nucleic acid-binding protein